MTRASRTAAISPWLCGTWAIRIRRFGPIAKCANWPAKSGTRTAWPMPCITPRGSTSSAESGARSARRHKKERRSPPRRASRCGVPPARSSREAASCSKAKWLTRFPCCLGGVAAFAAGGAELTLSFQFATLGEAYLQAGRFADAHAGARQGAGDRREERRALPRGGAVAAQGRAVASRVAGARLGRRC